MLSSSPAVASAGVTKINEVGALGSHRLGRRLGYLVEYIVVGLATLGELSR